MKKSSLIFASSVVLFSFIFVTSVQASDFSVHVYYNDSCPVNHALVQVYFLNGTHIGMCAWTNQTGWCYSPYFEFETNKWYRAYAYAPYGGPELGESMFKTDNNTDAVFAIEAYNNACPSGYCIDGFCCNSACSGNCDKCNVAGSEGNCTNVNSECTGNCDYCSNGNCAANETYCESTYKCSDCTGSGNSFSCAFAVENNDCNPFDLEGIATCDWNPDNYHPTWDFRSAFDSYCIGLDSCQTGDTSINHTCNQATCGAECDSTHSCQDKCIGDTRYFSGSCNSTCGCVFSTTDCNTLDGCYAYDTGCEDRNYYCTPGSCDYTYSGRNTDYNDSFVNYCSGDSIRQHRTNHDFYCSGTCSDHTSWVDDSLVQDCSLQNGWYDSGQIQWITETQCTERQQKEQKYRTYTCSNAQCAYSNTSTQWVNTTNTRNKNNGTSCDDGLYCTVSDQCTSGVCGGSARDCSANNISSIATCFNNPDSYNFTWDFRNPFTSVCNETNDSCTNGNNTITHTCSVNNCSAECDSTHSCDNKCIGNVRYYSGNCSLATCNCSFTTQNCDLQDGWYNTTNTTWTSTGQCTEKEQIQQEFRDYSCQPASCAYNVNNTRWIDTGQTRYKPNGTSCNDGLFCTVNDVCTSGQCGGSARDCSTNNLIEIAQCNYIPDSNPFTFDYAPGFTSQCNETLDICTNSTYNYTHACADNNLTDSGPVIPVGNGVRGCTAECDGFGTECQNKCVNNVRYFGGNCNLTSCGCSYSSNENCTDHNGCYAYDTGCEDRNYGCTPNTCNYTFSNRNVDYNDSFVNYCSSDNIRQHKQKHDFYCNGACSDHTSWIDDQLVENCNLQDNWYNTSTTQWVSTGQCIEKQQVQQEYRDYTCSAATCTYTVTQNRWVDTGSTRNKSNGTSCDDGLYCTVSDVCTNGICGGTTRDCSANNLQGIATCDWNPDNYHPTWDFRTAFTSQCNEGTDSCTQGNSTINHTCSKSQCGAQCDSSSPCSSGICKADCTCAQQTNPPIITILSPRNVRYGTLSVWANATLDKAGSWCGRSLDNGANATMTNSSGNWNNKMTGLSSGTHTVKFFCNDTSGNMGTNTTSFFYCYGDITGPTVGVPDGTVNMRDINLLIMNFNYRCNEPRFNPMYDLNDDCTVNMRDINIAIMNFNKKC